ncbi:MAG: Na+/H+ antiporter subunit G [Betaproteobacteria bacterium]|nr:Na+/H+ antiporter subunit G [Betaproteobacteria bacterium]MBL8533123.1 Na+/H+ antiporter subunit G [Betaproteobacteria bacterium]
MMFDILVSLLLLIGSAFVALGAVGLVRFPDLLTRLHGPTKASTLGLGCLLTASMLYFSNLAGYPSLREILITVFAVLASPVTALFIARAARARQDIDQPGERPHLMDGRKAPPGLRTHLWSNERPR